jgi:hypothetical protein
MGGVDLCDMFHALYRIDRRSKKYYLRIVYFLIGVAISNAWIIYNKNRAPENALSLREFQLSVSESMMNVENVIVATTRQGRKRKESLHESINESIDAIQSRPQVKKYDNFCIFKTEAAAV